MYKSRIFPLMWPKIGLLRGPEVEYKGKEILAQTTLISGRYIWNYFFLKGKKELFKIRITIIPRKYLS